VISITLKHFCGTFLTCCYQYEDEGWTIQCIEPTTNRFVPRGEEKSGLKYLRPRIEHSCTLSDSDIPGTPIVQLETVGDQLEEKNKTGIKTSVDFRSLFFRELREKFRLSLSKTVEDLQ